MFLIVGLGNPGKEYENTRHNAGFMVIDKLASKLNVSFDQSKFKANLAITNVNGEKVTDELIEEIKQLLSKQQDE